MNRIPLLLVSALALFPLASLAAEGKWTKAALSGQDLYATLKTSEGDMTVRLFSKDAPKTVANFVALASGEKEWTDKSSGKTSKKPLYPGTIFHRVIPGFMIQAGDPQGNGRGTPGYQFEDELQGEHTFEKPGMLAMANRGPNTNGSQFFITVGQTPWLNKKHTIFGEVVSGYEVAVKISEAPRGPADRPQHDVVLKSVELSEKPPKGLKAETLQKTKH